MKTIQYYTGLLSRVYVGGDENRPRVRVYLNGLNDFGNGFQSYSLPPQQTFGGNDLGISAANFDFGLQPVKGISVPPAVSVPPGLPTTFQYTTTFLGLGNANAMVIPSGFNRTLFQQMQQIAEHKPIVKSIKIQLYNYTPGFGSLIDNLGQLFLGKMEDPLVGDKPTADVFDLRQYFNPSLSNAGFSDPQAYLNAVNGGNFSAAMPYIEVNIPINKRFDGNTLLAIHAPVDPYSQVAQFVTLYI